MNRKTTIPSRREPIGRVGQRRQVVIPKDICETLQLKEGDFVAFRRQANGVLIKPQKPVNSDDVLSSEEGTLLEKAEQQIRRGEYVSIAELEHELDPKPKFLKTYLTSFVFFALVHPTCLQVGM